MAGDSVTGVTLMRMDEGLDTGPILATREVAIGLDDTTATLTERLARVGAQLLLETLPAVLAGELEAKPQPDEGVTLSRQLRKSDGCLDWERPAVELERYVRALTPWPGAYTTWDGQRMRVLAAEALPDWRGAERVGTVIPLGDAAAVVTGEGALKLLEVQLAGRKALPIDVFLCGKQECIGAELGT
jgi:methionyl-tRNA formyltransferase